MLENCLINVAERQSFDCYIESKILLQCSSGSDTDSMSSSLYGSQSRGLVNRAGVAASCAGIPRRISFRGKKRLMNSSKISLITSPSSHHNSTANMLQLPSPTTGVGAGSTGWATGLDWADSRRWSLSFSRSDFASGSSAAAGSRANFDYYSPSPSSYLVSSSSLSFMP